MNFNGKENHIESFNFFNCAEASKYEKIVKIGHGTFGEVFKARDRSNIKRFVAMKKILSDNGDEGFPITALREIKILQLLKHENVVHLIEICRSPAFLNNRDIKPANILVTKNGVLKLADFGLARAFSARKSSQANRFTNRVVTLWYRPPELLLGDRNYKTSVDLWGAGCIMAEMWTRSPVLKGATEQKQLTLISQLCGSITPEVWPGVESLHLFNKVELPKGQKRRVIDKLKPYIMNDYACDLLDKLLILDPNQRYDSDLALNHDFFWTDPMPSDLSKMMTQHTQSMFDLLERPRRLGPAQHLHGPIPSGAARPTMSVIGGYQDRVF